MCKRTCPRHVTTKIELIRYPCVMNCWIAYILTLALHLRRTLLPAILTQRFSGSWPIIEQKWMDANLSWSIPLLRRGALYYPRDRFFAKKFLGVSLVRMYGVIVTKTMPFIKNNSDPLPSKLIQSTKIPFSHSPNPNNFMIVITSHSDLHTSSKNPSLSAPIDFDTPELTLTTNHPNPRPSHLTTFVILRGWPNCTIEKLERKSEAQTNTRFVPANRNRMCNMLCHIRKDVNSL